MNKEPNLLDDLRQQGYRTFMFSRHPFTRILSAYKSKLENITRPGDSKKYNDRIGWKIVEKYRSEKDKERMKKVEPTLKEFVNYVLDEHQTPFKIQNISYHWNPTYWLTLPCGYNYTVYGKLETFSDDNDYILKKFNLSSITTAWINKAGADRDPEIYYKQINKEELEALYRQYRLDFLVFNYTYEPFPSYLGNSTLEDQYDVNVSGKTRDSKQT